MLVEFEPGTAAGLSLLTMERELSELLVRKVDLSTPSFLGNYLRNQILEEAEVQYESA